ncbi:MAG: flagellar motor switch protein FliN [Terracidiphilus sp.]
MNYIACWSGVASTLFTQALTGEPQLIDAAGTSPAGNGFGFEFLLTGDVAGRFTILLGADVLATFLVGEGVDQKAGWGELLRETADAAAGELLAKTGKKCRIETATEVAAISQASRAFRLESSAGSWTVQVYDETREAIQPKPALDPLPSPPTFQAAPASHPEIPAHPRFDLLLDVELEATLRFGCRELPLSEILELGPGDVVELDRHVTDPVDLIVSDKIVARGEVVLVNGNFGLRVTEVAAPRKRLESIRCLF